MSPSDDRPVSPGHWRDSTGGPPVERVAEMTARAERSGAPPPSDDPAGPAGSPEDRAAEIPPPPRPSRLARLRGVIAIHVLYAVAFVYVVILALPLFTDAPAPLKKVSVLEYLLNTEDHGRQGAGAGHGRAAADRTPLPAPPSAAASAGARFAPLPVFRGAVPVLAYHGIGDDPTDPFSVSRSAFEAQMAMLSRAGFHTITPAQYVRLLAGDRRGIPARPILITFDDGRLDSYRGADAVLARYGFRATMYVIAGQPEDHHRFYLGWAELRRMQRSGRWDIQEHAGRGHELIRYDARGHRGPAYAYRMWRNGRLETFEEYKRRVTSDILWGGDAIRRNIPGVRLETFAVPFGNYGHLRNNDPRIPAFLGAFLRARFAAVFIQEDVGFTSARTPRDHLGRYEVTRSTGDVRLYRWLRRHATRAR